VTRLVLMRGEEPTPEALMRGGQAAVEVREIALTLAREPGFAARDVITPKRTGVGITFEAVSVRPCATACTRGGLLGSREPAGSSSSIWPKERQDVCSPQSSAYDVYLPRCSRGDVLCGRTLSTTQQESSRSCEALRLTSPACSNLETSVPAHPKRAKTPWRRSLLRPAAETEIACRLARVPLI